MVSRSLRSRYTVVGRGQFFRAAKSLGVRASGNAGRSRAARSLRLDAVVGGSISRVRARWVLKVKVYSAHNGRIAGSATFPLRGTRVDSLTARRVPGQLAGAINRCRRGAPVSGAVARRPRRRKPRRRSPRPAAPQPQPVAPQPQPVAPQPQPTDGFDDGTDLYQTSPAAPQPTLAPDDDEVGEFGAGTTTPSATTPGVSDDLGFEVNGGGQIAPAPAAPGVPTYGASGGISDPVSGGTVSASPGQRRPWEKVIEAAVGFMMASRKFEMGDTSIYRMDGQGKRQQKNGKDVAYIPPVYSTFSKPTAMFVIDAAFYPIALFHRGPMANLGLVGHFDRVFYLESGSSSPGEPKYTTNLYNFSAGLRYRWNILDRATGPTIKVGIDYGRLRFSIKDAPTSQQEARFLPDPANKTGIADVGYHYLKVPYIGLEMPFFATPTFTIGGAVAFDYMLVLSAGEVEQTNCYIGYGHASTWGIDLDGGLFASYGLFTFKLNGFYRHISFTFDPDSRPDTPKNAMISCKKAGTAKDVYAGGYLQVGIAY